MEFGPGGLAGHGHSSSSLCCHRSGWQQDTSRAVPLPPSSSRLPSGLGGAAVPQAGGGGHGEGLQQQQQQPTGPRGQRDAARAGVQDLPGHLRPPPAAPLQREPADRRLSRLLRWWQRSGSLQAGLVPLLPTIPLFFGVLVRVLCCSQSGVCVSTEVKIATRNSAGCPVVVLGALHCSQKLLYQM